MSCFLILTSACRDHLITKAALPIMVQIFICEVCFLYLSSHKFLFHYIYSADDHWHVWTVSFYFPSSLHSRLRDFIFDYHLNLTLYTFLIFWDVTVQTFRIVKEETLAFGMLLDVRTKIFSRINIILKIWVTASISFISSSVTHSLPEDEIVGWCHRLNGHEFEQTTGDSEGQESLVCCCPWGCKESDTDMTEQLNKSISLYYQCFNLDSARPVFLFKLFRH